MAQRAGCRPGDWAGKNSEEQCIMVGGLRLWPHAVVYTLWGLVTSQLGNFYNESITGVQLGA